MDPDLFILSFVLSDPERVDCPELEDLLSAVERRVNAAGPSAWLFADTRLYALIWNRLENSRIRRELTAFHRSLFVGEHREAQVEASAGKSLEELLREFEDLRRENLVTLRSWDLTEEDLAGVGQHPELGLVTLRHLLATRVVHDLGHVAQIARSMARRYGDDVGPWREYLPVLRDRDT